MSATNAIARDENVRNLPTIAGGESDGKDAPFPIGILSPCRERFRIFSFRQRQWAMPESCAGGMKIPE